MILDYTETECLSKRIDCLFRELQKAIKYKRHNILLAVYRSERVRNEVEKVLGARLRALGYRTERVCINEQNPDLPRDLRERANRAATVYFVCGVRFGGGADGQNGYRALNLRREYFVDCGLHVVLWLTEEEERLLPRYAPDFWAFRHRVVTFLDDSPAEQMEQV
jgi:hypothetical protein